MEHDHVKDNLPAKLLRIRTFRKIKLEEFKDLLSIADYKICETKMVNSSTWYPLTLDVFAKFLYKVICFLYFPQLPFSHAYTHSLFCSWFVPEGDIRRGGYRRKVVP